MSYFLPLRLRVILEEHPKERLAGGHAVKDGVQHPRRRVDLVQRRLEVTRLRRPRGSLARVLVVDPPVTSYRLHVARYTLPATNHQ